MSDPAPMLHPPTQSYRGLVPRPERWATYAPRRGDIIVCTPSKSGTTWTQSILAMLLHGGPDLPMPLPRLSPWVDADLGIPPETVTADLAAQTGRRVVKTHTPLDGFPDWEGVRVITVYRHPLDVFFSLRRHYENMVSIPRDSPLLAPLDAALESFRNDPFDREDWSSRTLASLALHYGQTLETTRDPRPAMLHYADMVADHRGAVARLAEIAEIDTSGAVIDAVTEATSFPSMKQNSGQFAPAAGTGLFRSDETFFDQGGARSWRGRVPDKAHALYTARLAELIPDPAARGWLETGGALPG